MVYKIIGESKEWRENVELVSLKIYIPEQGKICGSPTEGLTCRAGGHATAVFIILFLSLQVHVSFASHQQPHKTHSLDD